MKLRGQPAGYAMVVLLISLSIMAVMMTVVMPVCKQTARREKEAELVFRGEQYARAINLLQRKSVGALPPSIDFLVDQKFLRKKFKDPITDDDFAPVLLSVAAAPGGTRGAQPGGSPPGGPPGSGRGAAAPTTGAPGSSTPGSPAGAGITGVTSKSKETSIRLYKGRNHYNEWLFVYTPPPAPPGGAPGAPGRGGPRGGGPQGPVNPQVPPLGGPTGPPGNPRNPNPPGGPGNPTGPGRGVPPVFRPFGPGGR
jgi:type II secretory pathway pseudopilin PulG